MDIKELEDIMVSEGIAIRAIPLKTVGIFEKYHINEFPHGTIQYLDEFKREMLVVERIPKNAGKFFLQTAKHLNSIVKFNGREPFDSIEDAIKNYKEKNMGSNNITNIESIVEAQAKEMSLESMRIKEHNIYLVDLGDTYGYSCLVFKNNHHIHYANDYESHHTGKTRQELRQIYIKEMNNKLFTEAELSAPLMDYNEYTRKCYFLHNYYGMQVDYISIFHLNPTEEFKKDFRKQTEHMTYNPVSFSYMYDSDFVTHHMELLAKLEKAKAKTSSNYEYLKKAYLYEMHNHEYGINLQADHDVLSVFGKIQYHGESMDALKTYFEELNFTDVQRRAYLDARTQYFKESGCY